MHLPDQSLIDLFFSDLRQTVLKLQQGSLAKENLVIAKQGALIIGWDLVASTIDHILQETQQSSPDQEALAKATNALISLSKLPNSIESYQNWCTLHPQHLFTPSPDILPTPSLLLPSEPPPLPNESSSDLSELFILELQNHLEAMNSAILVLEAKKETTSHIKVEDPQIVNSLMRSAHGLKGAARAVGLSPLVPLLHNMENIFEGWSGSQRDISLLNSLFAALDLLSELQQEKSTNWSIFLESRKAKLNQLITFLSPDSSSSPADPSICSPPIQLQETITPQKQEDIPVPASRLTAMIGLAAEILISSQSFLASLKQKYLLKGETEAAIQSLIKARQHLSLIKATPLAHMAYIELEQTMAILLGVQQATTEELSAEEDRTRKINLLSQRLHHTIVGSRMRPFRDGTRSFPRAIRDLAQTLGKRVSFLLHGAETEVDREILQKLEIPLTHLIRNSLSHGIELPEERIRKGKPPEGRIKLEAMHQGGMLHIHVSDDGAGIDRERIKTKILEKGLCSQQVVQHLSDQELFDFLFLPGFSTAEKVTEFSGRGVGLDLVKEMILRYNGTIHIDSKLGLGCSFRLKLPITLSFLTCLIIDVQGEAYALPLTKIERLIKIDRSRLHKPSTQTFVTLEDPGSHPIPLFYIKTLLQLDRSDEPPINEDKPYLELLLLKDHSTTYALSVDKLCYQVKLMVSPLDPRLGRIPALLASAILETGEPVLILDVEDLLSFLQQAYKGSTAISPSLLAPSLPINSSSIHPLKILIVEDSATVRELERRLLVGCGYQVDTASDGLAGWNCVTHQQYDLIITDIDMPRMNGLELLQKIRSDPNLAPLPVIVISYKNRQADQDLAFSLGASAYLPKSSFENQLLLQEINRLFQSSS
jgi:two-component system sensor histidine kinase and response regulator WspE